MALVHRDGQLMNVSRHGWDTFDTLIIVILNMSPPLRGGHLLTNDGMQGQGAKNMMEIMTSEDAVMAGTPSPAFS